MFTHSNAQVSFSPVVSKLSLVKGSNPAEIICSGPTLSIKFKVKRTVDAMPQNNFCKVDGQAIQITPLKIDGYKKSAANQSLDGQKTLLSAYTNYELDYCKNDLHIEVIDPSNQWVMIKSRGWFIWYYKVGKVPVQVANKTKIQLFASTVIGDNILTINAPIFGDTDFNKAALIVNDMMETLTIGK